MRSYTLALVNGTLGSLSSGRSGGGSHESINSGLDRFLTSVWSQEIRRGMTMINNDCIYTWCCDVRVCVIHLSKLNTFTGGRRHCVILARGLYIFVLNICSPWVKTRKRLAWLRPLAPTYSKLGLVRVRLNAEDPDHYSSTVVEDLWKKESELIGATASEMSWQVV